MASTRRRTKIRLDCQERDPRSLHDAKVEEAGLSQTSSSATELIFPKDFLWGVSTASYQVEGNNDNSQWSDWEKQGRIRSGDRSGMACDWWTNAETDFDLAQQIGINALRLSLEWSRIEPEEGKWDPWALARYRKLLEGLQQRGIRPVLCLHHFTNPRWFEQKGAFLHPDAVARFQRFTRYVVENLRDGAAIPRHALYRLPRWLTRSVNWPKPRGSSRRR